MLEILHKKRKIILMLIIVLGFFLRLHAAAGVPVNWDEEDDLVTTRKMFPVNQDMNLAQVEGNLDTGNIGIKILIRFGWYLFGDSLFGARLPFVILGTIIIFFVYLLTSLTLGTHTALLASFLLSISQYDIGITRYVDSATPLVFFTIISLLFFYKALLKDSKLLILLSGLSIGIGFWFKENACFLIPIYVIFLISCREYRHWLKNKYLWLSFAMAMSLILFNAYFTLVPGAPRHDYFGYSLRAGLSINAIGLYLGELVLLLLKPFKGFYSYVMGSLDPQFPIVNFVLGILILMAVARSLRSKRPFVKLLVVCFLFNFIPFMFLRGGVKEIDSFWCLSNLDWSILNFIPGVILAASMLMDFSRRFNWKKGLLFGGVVVFMLIRTLHFISFPLSYCFPAMDHSLNIQLDVRGPHFLELGEIEAAKDIFRRIYEVADEGSQQKRQAALKLAEILIREGRHKEGKKHLYYILSNNPDDRDALRLLN